MTDGPKVRLASPREVYNIAILGEYFLGDLRSHTEYMNGRLPCAVHLPTGTTDQIDQMREDGDISPDIWSTIVLYTKKSDLSDADLNVACQYFQNVDAVEHILILDGGYDSFLSYYGEKVCMLEDNSVIYPAQIDDAYPIFLSGEYVAKTRQVFTDLGITHVLNVAKEAATPFVGDKSLGLTYMHIPIIDDESQDVISIFNQCISFIDDCLQRAHGKVLVHCVEADEALRLLRQARPIVSPNRGFVSQLRVFEASLHE